MAQQVNMRETRNWYGKRIFVMDDTSDKPKTWADREGEAISDFFFSWFKWTLIPALAALILYLLVPTEPLLGHPWNAFFMAGATLTITNAPNWLIMVIRLVALWLVTYGR